MALPPRHPTSVMPTVPNSQNLKKEKHRGGDVPPGPGHPIPNWGFPLRWRGRSLGLGSPAGCSLGGLHSAPAAQGQVGKVRSSSGVFSEACPLRLRPSHPAAQSAIVIVPLLVLKTLCPRNAECGRSRCQFLNSFFFCYEPLNLCSCRR